MRIVPRDGAINLVIVSGLDLQHMYNHTIHHLWASNVYIHILPLSFFHTGGRVVHSYGRLIPHEFPITDLQQISGPDGIGRITCTVSNGTVRFITIGKPLTEGVMKSEVTTTLAVNQTDNFQNKEVYCNKNTENYFYLFISDKCEFTVMLE